MTTMRSLMDEYALESVGVFNEFDKTNFITNAKFSLGNGLFTYGHDSRFDISPITTSIAKAKEHLNSIEIDTFALSEFLPAVIRSEKIDRISYEMPDLAINALYNFKTQYLIEATNELRNQIELIASGNLEIKEVKLMVANEDTYTNALKRRCIQGTPAVSGELRYNLTPKAMLHRNEPPKMVVTRETLQTVVIPYIKTIPARKKDVLVILDKIESDLRLVSDTMNQIQLDTKAYISGQNIDKAMASAMLNLMYVRSRSILEVASTIGFYALDTAHLLDQKLTALQGLYNTYQRAFADQKDIVESGGYSTKIISATDANSLCDAMLNRDVSVFVELSNHIAEYHDGYLSHILDADTQDVSRNIIDDGRYDNKIYDEIIKMYIEIGNGIDILAKNADDYLMVFNDLIRKSGFMVPLEQRFSDVIDSIEDLSNYKLTEIPGAQTASDSYINLLSEIKAFPENVKKISDTASDMFEKIHYTTALFNRDKNGELANSETMNELKIFMEGLTDQFEIVTRRTAIRLYDRLKDLAAKADACLDLADNGYRSQEDPIWADAYQRDEDFVKEAYEKLIDTENELNDIYMEDLVREYYRAREFNERGVTMVFEADEPATAEVNAQAPTEGGDAAKQAEGDNTNQQQQTTTQGTTTKLSNAEKIRDVFNKFMATIQDFMDKIAKSNAQLLKPEIKNYLLTFDWMHNGPNNGPAKITLPNFEKMKGETIVGDAAAVASNINRITVSSMINHNTYEAVRNELLQTTKIGQVSQFKNTPVAQERQAIQTYYNSGQLNRLPDGKYPTVERSGQEADNLMKNEILPFCENLYQKYLPEIKNHVKAAQDAAIRYDKVVQAEAGKNKTESAVDMMLHNDEGFIYEAEKDQATTDANNNSISLSTKEGWMRRILINYYGSVMNALRERNSIYTRSIIMQIVPKEMLTSTKVINKINRTVNQTTQTVNNATGQNAEGNAQ